MMWDVGRESRSEGTLGAGHQLGLAEVLSTRPTVCHILLMRSLSQSDTLDFDDGYDTVFVMNERRKRPLLFLFLLDDD